jgi:hypothetical protein
MHRNLEKLLFWSFLLLSILIHTGIYLGMPQLDLEHFSLPTLDVIALEPATPTSSLQDVAPRQPKIPATAAQHQQQTETANTAVNDAEPPTAPMPDSASSEPPESASASTIPAIVSMSPAPQLPPKFLASYRETLHFDIYWLGMHVGTAVLDALNKESGLTITSRINSNAIISAFYRVEDSAECRIVDGKATSFKLKVQEGKHRRDRETIFDYVNDRIRFLNHLQNDEKHFPMNSKKYWDVISGFYYVRTMALSVGQKVSLDIFDSGKFANTAVDVIRTEMTTLVDGRQIETLVVKPVIVTDGLFKKTGDIYIWLTNDEYKTPVRVETSIKIGTVTAELRGIEIEK